MVYTICDRSRFVAHARGYDFKGSVQPKRNEMYSIYTLARSNKMCLVSEIPHGMDARFLCKYF